MPIPFRTLTISLALITGACATTGGPTTSAEALEARSETVATALPVALERAHHHLAAGHPKEALGFAELALTFSPGHPEALRLSAKSALGIGDTSTAISRFTELQALAEDDPTQGADPETEGLLGLALMRSGETAQAEPYLLSALARDPMRWREAVALAVIARESGDADRSLSLLSLAEKASGSRSIIDRERGETALAAGQHSQAVAAFARAASSMGDTYTPTPSHRLALALNGQTSTALEGASDTEAAVLHRELAARAIKEGRKTDAVAHLKTSRALAPRHDARTDDLLAQALRLGG